MQLVDLLIKKGYLKDEDRAAIVEVQISAPNKPIHELLMDRGFAREEHVLNTLAEAFGMDLVDLTKVNIEAETLKAMPMKLVHRKALMPLSRNNGTLTVATGDPYDVYSLDELQTLTGLRIQPVLASPREIQRLIKTYFGVGGETVTALVQERPKDEVELLEDIEADDSELAKMAQEASVVKLVNEILIEAANERASDIHVEPEEKTLRIRYRIDGILQTQVLPPEITRFQAAIISRIKIMSRLNIPRNVCRRMAASRCVSKAARSTFVCPSSRWCTAKVSSCVCSTRAAWCSTSPTAACCPTFTALSSS